MEISRLSISDFLKFNTEDYIKENILKKFKSLNDNSVQDFLYKKSISFEKSSISTTHLIFDENDSLLGYFSVANTSLILSKEKFDRLSKTKQNELKHSGQELENSFYVINSYLLGQLGKNYNLPKEKQIDGNSLLSLAFELLLEAKELINARYVWLECENSEKLINFYKNFGFKKIDNFTSEHGLVVMTMKLDKK